MALKHRRATHKLLIFFALSLFVASMLLTSTPPANATDVTVTKTFLADSSDGELYWYGSTYSTVRTYPTGTVSDTGTLFNVGQYLTTGIYTLKRGFLYFDTGTIPSGASIENATLSLYVAVDQSTTDFNVTLQSGSSSPHNPLQSGDYYYAWYSGNGGSRNSSEIVGVGYWNITLSTTGEGYIDDAGTTKFALRSSNDVSNTAPTGNEYVSFYSSEQGSSYAPILYVCYTVSGGAVAVLHGPYVETGDVYNGITYGIVTYANNSTDTFLFNGTDATADTETITSDQLPVSVYWNCSSDGTKYRQYYFTEGSSSEEVWLYVADSTEVLSQYYVSVTDFAGLTNAYAITMKNIAGTMRNIEKQPLDVLNNLPYFMVTFTQYEFKIVSDQGSFTWNLPADAVSTKSFVVTRDMVTTEIEDQNFTVQAYRSDDTNIIVYYYDPSTYTVQVTTNILYYTGTEYNVAYDQTDVGNTQSFTWTGADATTDYYANVTAYFVTGETLNWFISIPPSAATEAWWGTAFDVFGTLPFPASQLPGLFIVALFFGYGSWKDAEVVLLLGLIVAGFLSYIGWLDIPVMGLSMAFGIVVFMIIHKGKETSRVPL